MKKILYAVLIVLSMMQGIFLPPDAVVLWLLFWAMFVNDLQALVAAFVAGFLVDSITFQQFGTHSIAYVLAISLVLILLRLAIFPPKFFVVFCYCFLCFVMYQLVSAAFLTQGAGVHIGISSLLADSGIMGVALLWMRGHFDRLFKRPLRLSKPSI